MTKQKERPAVPVIPWNVGEEDLLKLRAITEQHAMIIELSKALTCCQLEEAAKLQSYKEAKARAEDAEESLDGAIMVLVDLCGDDDLPLQKAAREGNAQGRAPGDESWRNWPLASLGGKPELSVGDVEKFAAAGIKTVGDLADWEAKHSNHVGVKGAGAATWGRVADSMAGFWARWNAEPGRKAQQAAEVAACNAVTTTPPAKPDGGAKKALVGGLDDVKGGRQE
jgi:hypothetical protein